MPTRRTLFAVLLACMLPSAPLTAQSIADQFLQNLVDSARQEVENNGRVDKIDYSIAPSVVITTLDGRTFQLKSVSFNSDDEPIDLYLGNVDRIRFLRTQGEDYTLHITYRSLAAPDGDHVARVLANAINKTLESNQLAKRHAKIQLVLGTTLAGEPWVLSTRSSPLRSLQIIHE